VDAGEKWPNPLAMAKAAIVKIAAVADKASCLLTGFLSYRIATVHI
jgi:hypothetical protein